LKLNYLGSYLQELKGLGLIGNGEAETEKFFVQEISFFGDFGGVFLSFQIEEVGEGAVEFVVGRQGDRQIENTKKDFPKSKEPPQGTTWALGRCSTEIFADFNQLGMEIIVKRKTRWKKRFKDFLNFSVRLVTLNITVSAQDPSRVGVHHEGALPGRIKENGIRRLFPNPFHFKKLLAQSEFVFSKHPGETAVKSFPEKIHETFQSVGFHIEIPGWPNKRCEPLPRNFSQGLGRQKSLGF